MAYPSNTISTESVAQDQLRAFVERIERMNEERRAIADDIKEIYAEARGNGFDTKVLKIIIREREQDPSELLERGALLDLYRAALGMQTAPRDDNDDEVGTVVATRARARSELNSDPGIGAVADSTSRNGGMDQQAGVEAPAGTAASEKVKEERKDQNAPPSSDGGQIPGADGSITPRTNFMQEGSEPIEAHNLDRAGSTPAPATPPVDTNLIAFTPKPFAGFTNSKGLKRLNGCRDPETCHAMQPSKSLCNGCAAVSSASVEIPHHGSVA